MPQGPNDAEPYYAEDGMVWKRPVRKPNENGGASITLGFPVCTMHEAVGGDAAQTVAELMNAGHHAIEAAAQAEKK